MRRSVPYSRYAAVYDLIGQRQFGERIAHATVGWLAERGVRPRRAADLACGTGAATLVLAQSGAVTTGVDRSREMLDGAMAAAVNAGLTVTWTEQDIRELVLSDAVDLATSFFDSLNYLIEDGDLGRVFHRVRAALRPGGYFVFDLNTRRRLAEGWGDTSIIAADRDNLFGAYRSWFDPRTGLSPLTMTFFERAEDGSDCWRRFDEEHIERAYELAEVEDLLALSGFDVVEIRAFHDGSGQLGGQGTEASERVVFFAQRGRGPRQLGGDAA